MGINNQKGVKTSLNSRLLSEIDKIEGNGQVKKFLENILLEENVSDLRTSERAKERYKKLVNIALNNDDN